MVCSAQHHLITIFKQQIRGVGRTFHRGEGKVAFHAGVFRDEKRAPLKTPAWRLMVRGSSASSSREPQTKLGLSGHNRLATESAKTET